MRRMRLCHGLTVAYLDIIDKSDLHAITGFGRIHAARKHVIYGRRHVGYLHINLWPLGLTNSVHGINLLSLPTLENIKLYLFWNKISVLYAININASLRMFILILLGKNIKTWHRKAGQLNESFFWVGSFDSCAIIEKQNCYKLNIAEIC